jgi:HK97 family phage major capsid protein
MPTYLTSKNQMEVNNMSEQEKLIKAAEAGAFVSGGIGSATATDADGNVSPATSLGNVTGGTFGVTTGANAVNPTGSNSGILNPEQARRFIDYVWDATVLAKDGRRVTMRANTMEIEKVNVGERVIRAAAQADDAYTNAGATFTKVELTTKKIRLDWEVSTESLEDNIEGAALEDRLVRLMTNAFANDIEDLAINGDGATGSFLSIMSGFIKQTRGTVGNAAHEADVTVSDNEWTPQVMQDIILAMPRKYRALKSNLKFYAGTDAFQGIVKNNGTLADAIAEAIAGQTPGSTQANRQSYLDGLGQTFGGSRTTRVLGVDVLEVPYYPAGYVDLTFPENRVWGFQRDITVNREYKPKKDTVEYTVFVRFGIAWEELDAVAYGDADSADS